MTLKQEGNIINIEGNIKSIEDYEQITSALDNVKASFDSIILNIKNSISITSSVIGYLVKLANEGKKIYLNVGSEDLYDLLDELNLINLFSVKRV